MTVPRSLSIKVCRSQNVQPPSSPVRLPAPPQPPKIETLNIMCACTQPPTNTETIRVVSTEYYCNSAWASNSTAFGLKTLNNMGWKEAGSHGNPQHGMTTNLRPYCLSNNVGVGVTINLHGNPGWSKTNDNFGGVLEVLRREPQMGTTGNIILLQC